MTRIDAFFKPPRFEDEEKTHQAFLLHIILWALIIVTILYFVYALLFSQEVTRRVLTQVFVGVVLNAFLLIMVRYGYVHSASIIQIAAFWVFFTATAWTAAGVQHQAYQIGYALVIFIAGILMGLRGALIVMGVSLLSGGLMMVVSDMGSWSFKSPDKALDVWVISAILFPMLVILQYLGGRLLRIALAQTRISEAQYRLLADNIKDQVWLMDLNLKPTYISPSVEKLRGYTFEEIAQLPLDKHLTATSLQSAMEFFSIEMPRALADPTYYLTRTLELEFYCKDGSTLWVESTFTLIRDENGKPLSLLGSGRNITERRLAEEALRESEEKYRNILESIDDGYCEQDLVGNFTFLNDSMCRIYGYPKEELMGMNYKQHTDKENGRKCFQAYRKIYITGEPGKVFDFEIIRKDGAKRHIESSVSLQKNSAGKPIAFRGIVRDVTERKSAEEMLHQSEKRYRTLVEKANEAIYVAQDGMLKFVNPAGLEIAGYSEQEITSKPFIEFIQPDDRAMVGERYLERLRGEGFESRYAFRLITKNGDIRWLELGAALINFEGRPATLNFVTDITERKRAEDALKKNSEELIKKNQELEESRKNVQITLERLGVAYEELRTSNAKILQQEKMASIGQLAAGVAHEINNPMTFIASNLGTLDKYIRRLKDFIQAQAETIKSLKSAKAGEKLEKKRKELKLDYTINDIDLLVKETINGSERVQKIVQELNRFSRIADEEYKDTNINECIERSINIVWNELKDKATLHKDYGNLPLTKCYALKLDQVFINLLINAIQAIEEKGKIEIKTWEKDHSIWIAISDTGCGIPRENQNKIFEPFFTTKEVGTGTGLGLSISYEIIQRHKGEISFESNERKGTTFTIRMPIV
jgi:PAS domain S-box-containing protein